MNQRKMYRISSNNPVRRRLVFGENVEDQARVDNFANKLQESEAREMEEKSKKWGFDFKNEVPLDGPYEWYKRDGDKWIGLKVHKRDSVDNKDDIFTGTQYNNENTPVRVRDDTVPDIRVKRNNIEHRVIRQSVKRKMNLDDSDSCVRRRRSDN